MLPSTGPKITTGTLLKLRYPGWRHSVIYRVHVIKSINGCPKQFTLFNLDTQQVLTVQAKTIYKIIESGWMAINGRI